MAGFQTFSLGDVLSTAESIKGARRQSKLDELREISTRQQIDIQGQQAKQAQTQFTEQQRLENTRWLANATDQVLAITDPAQQMETLKTLGEEGKRRGILAPNADLSGVDMAKLAQLNRNAKLSLGSAPQQETIRDESGAVLQRDPTTGALKQVVAPQKPAPVDHFAEAEAGRNARAAQTPKGQFRALNAQEIEAAGLPAGSSAQIDEGTGKIDVLSKRDATAALSQKDATAAKLKLTTIQVGRRQLENIRKAFEEGRTGINAFGPGQGLLPTQAGKKFDAAINQIRGTWTALKRVPGIGSMSDYESKMDAAQFPGRNDYESVIEQKLQDMEDQLALLENGYSGLLSGGSGSNSANATEQASPKSGATYKHASGATVEILQ
jgi:hypothetical protein